jgi:hypothetical protein
MKTISEILELLRQRAEEATAEAAATRRPSWGPALAINEEFITQIHSLGLLKDDDKPVMRLWAQFADPRRRGTIVRERTGLTLAGIRCRGFSAHVGMTRKGACLFWAKRGHEGGWELGPKSWEESGGYDHYRLRRDVRDQRSQCERFAQTIDECGGPEQQPNMVGELERMQQRCAELEQAYRTAQVEIDAQNIVRARLLVLARERVIEFGGGDFFTQLVAGAHVSGHCCVCGKTLTDPVSVERGIGPDCWGKHAVQRMIAAWVSAAAPAPVEDEQSLMQEARHA